MQSENGVFAFISEAKPALGGAKVCKARGMQSENGVFAFISEAPSVPVWSLRLMVRLLAP